ncbi:hypothetical protein ACN28S_39775 [Cystobacter fuscus]
MTAKETGAIEVVRDEKIEPKRAGEIGFGDLIAPLTPDVFFSEYWEQKPLVTRGRARDFSLHSSPPRTWIGRSATSSQDLDGSISSPREGSFATTSSAPMEPPTSTWCTRVI